jgi:hypothetical protein
VASGEEVTHHLPLTTFFSNIAPSNFSMKQPAKPAAASPHSKTSTTKKQENFKLFGKENIKWMLIGAVVIAIGFILMVGGKSPDPKVFDEDSVYSHRRITIAPILIIAGLLIQVYAIMRKPKNAE